MATQILVVNDDAEPPDLLCGYLASRGFEVSMLRDAGSLQHRRRRDRPDLIVLDVLMRGVNGLTALRTLRAAGDEIPVIMLNARVDEMDRIAGLELGADDCLSKPCNPRELVARIQSVLRPCGKPLSTATPQKRASLAFGSFTLDFQSRTLSVECRSFRLSDREFTLLNIFVNSPMCTFNRERLLTLLHGPKCLAADRGIDVQVWRLRRLLETDPSMPRFIQTVRGHGYVFVPNGKRAVRSGRAVH
jgi:two-component system phosphate regulon response regulator OmpR